MLKKLVSGGVSVEVIAKKFGKQYPAVHMKMRRLGLEVDVNKKIDTTTTSTTAGPSADLLTPEQALDLLSDSMPKIRRGGLSELELLEIRATVQVVSRYYGLYAKFVDYVGLEKKLPDLAEKYEKLAERQEHKNTRTPMTRDMIDFTFNRRFFHKNYELLVHVLLLLREEGLGRLWAGSVSRVWVLVLFMALFGVVLHVPVVKASETIYIRADGTIDPPTPLISTVDNITYTFNADINGPIVIERNNILVDGAGYTVTGSGSGNGITLASRSNVTVRNMTIKNFHYGFWLGSSSSNTLSGNNVAHNWYGFWLGSSSSNTLSGNNVTANRWYGIWLDYSSSNTLSGNNFIDNTYHVSIWSPGYANSWDDGYPSGGNYWSSYGGTDTNCDGIGDSNCTIDADNVDRYPLMGMYNCFNATSELAVETICNSTISGFQFNGTTISFDVTGDNCTTGFCRISIPTPLMNGTFQVFVNGTEISYSTVYSNSTYNYLYFNYTHSTEQVVIFVPEFPLFFIIPTFMIGTLLFLAYRRKKRCVPLLGQQETET